MVIDGVADSRLLQCHRLPPAPAQFRDLVSDLAVSQGAADGNASEYMSKINAHCERLALETEKETPLLRPIRS